MKRTKIICALVLLLVGCATTEQQIRSSAQHYLDATGRYDVADACLYCTPETADGLRLLDTTVMRIVDSNYIRSNMPAEVKITAINITSDSTAEVEYHKHTPIADLDGTIDMVLRDGDWMASVKISIPYFLRNDHQEFHYDSVGELRVVE